MNKILIWGTGEIAKKILNNGLCAEVIGFIETSKTKESFRSKPVYSASKIPQEYDYIIVANAFAFEVYQLCLEKNINLKKVIFLQKVKKAEGF